MVDGWSGPKPAPLLRLILSAGLLHNHVERLGRLPLVAAYGSARPS